jgi:hypothetical protein
MATLRNVTGARGPGYDANNNPVLFGEHPILDLVITYPDPAAAGAQTDRVFFQCPVGHAYEVTAISEIHSAAGTNGSAVSIQVTKDTGTDAPGAGTDLLTNNTGAGFDAKGTANTTQAGTLTATIATRRLAAGNRLSVDYAGTLTALAGVIITVVLKRINP